MPRRFATGKNEIILCMLVSALCVSRPLRTTVADESNGGASPRGSVRGNVRYQANPQKPWRLGRYYIKKRGSGELAEAIIAVHDRDAPTHPPSHEPRTVVVNQKDFQFSPETVAIRAGDRIEFLNNDSQVHNVRTTHDRLSFNVNMPAGGHHLQTFEFAGGIRKPYQVGCVYHSAMRSWIFVFDHPWYQLTDASGKFELRDLPTGKYRIELIHPAGELRASQTIEVKNGETTELNFVLTVDDRTATND